MSEKQASKKAKTTTANAQTAEIFFVRTGEWVAAMPAYRAYVERTDPAHPFQEAVNFAHQLARKYASKIAAQTVTNSEPTTGNT